jgi:hypothetical protein
VRLRDRTDDKADGILASASLSWEIRPWHQVGKRVYLCDATEFQDGLLQMVRTNAQSACTLATFPPSGKRVSDSTIHLTIVVPPERFSQYEQLVRFAMTLPVGSVVITLPTPWIIEPGGDNGNQQLLAPGCTSLLEEIEIAVSRAPVVTYTPHDLRPDRRTPVISHALVRSIADEDTDWLTFRRDEPSSGSRGT